MKPKIVYPPCETYRKANQSKQKSYFGANRPNIPAPRHTRPEGQSQIQERANQSNSNEIVQAAAQNIG